jgi:hypothetical protein
VTNQTWEGFPPVLLETRVFELWEPCRLQCRVLFPVGPAVSSWSNIWPLSKARGAAANVHVWWSEARRGRAARCLTVTASSISAGWGAGLPKPKIQPQPGYYSQPECAFAVWYRVPCLPYCVYLRANIQCVWMLRLHRVTWSFLSVFSIDGAVDKAGVRQPTFPIGFAGDSVWYPAPILEFIWQFMRDIYSTFQTSFGPISPLLLVACEVFFLDNVKILGYDILLHCCSRWINLKVDCSCLLSP